MNVILNMPDTKLPAILSGPNRSSIESTSAVIGWQTNELAKGGVKYGLSDPPLSAVAETAYKTVHSQMLTGLTPSTTYYVSVYATDKAGNGPVSSAVVSFTTKPLPDTKPPVIVNGPVAASVTHNAIVLELATDEPSTVSVNYGLTDALGQNVIDSSLVQSRRISLVGLASDTVYYVRVSVADAVGNGPTQSAILTIRTLPAPDTSAPLITEGPMALNVTSTTANILWTTNEPATNGVSYNDGEVYGVFTDDTLATNHSAWLTDLTPNTTYYFTVSTTDALGNGPTLSQTMTFRTLPVVDTRPPVFIEEPVIVWFNKTNAHVRWTTDEPSDTVVEYGTTAVLGTIDGKSGEGLQTLHTMPLTKLEPGTTYFVRVRSTDAYGNGPTLSQTFSFTTEGAQHADDEAPPQVVAGPAIEYNKNGKVIITWETDTPCDSVVKYGEGGELRYQKADGQRVTKHRVQIDELQPGVEYRFEATSTDEKGRSVVVIGD